MPPALTASAVTECVPERSGRPARVYGDAYLQALHKMMTHTWGLCTWLGVQAGVRCWGRRRRTTAAHVPAVAVAHGRVAQERDSEYRAARAHEGALRRLGRAG